MKPQTGAKADAQVHGPCSTSSHGTRASSRTRSAYNSVVTLTGTVSR